MKTEICIIEDNDIRFVASVWHEFENHDARVNEEVAFYTKYYNVIVRRDRYDQKLFPMTANSEIFR